MLFAWFVTSLLIWGLIPGLTYLECLVIGACVTPTDPVLANSICKGEWNPVVRIANPSLNDLFRQEDLPRRTFHCMCEISSLLSLERTMGSDTRSCTLGFTSSLYIRRAILGIRWEERYWNGRSSFNTHNRKRLIKNALRFYNIILYQILLSCIIGAIIGYVARKILRFAEERK